MKMQYFIISLLLSITGFINSAYSQNCNDYHKSNCRVENAAGFKLSSLSRSHYLEVGKTITYEVVLYGHKEIIMKFCTEEGYYPIRFKLKSSVTGEIIYDNKYDHYNNTISLSLDRTELISIEISIVSNKENINVLKGTKACVGMAIYMEDTKVRQ